jgi:Tol biopolymer transport system component
VGNLLWRQARAMLVCAWLIVLLAGFDTPTPAATSGGKIAFTRLTSQTEGDIYVMNADGSEQVQLTTTPGIELLPSWSPDGSQIAFVATSDVDSFDLYVMNADGTDIQQLTDGAADAFASAWSPDGTRIAYVAGLDGRDEIHLINLDGSDESVLVEGLWPSWSPDGAQLVITVGIWTDSSLAFINADGTGLTELEMDVPNASEAAWSPDGSQIAFVSNANGYENSVEEWNEDIWLVNTDGTELRHLVTLEGNDHWPPAWSPDGTQLAFTHDVSQFESHIYVVDVDDGELTQLTSEGYSSFPAWQPT